MSTENSADAQQDWLGTKLLQFNKNKGYKDQEFYSELYSEVDIWELIRDLEFNAWWISSIVLLIFEKSHFSFSNDSRIGSFSVWN